MKVSILLFGVVAALTTVTVSAAAGPAAKSTRVTSPVGSVILCQAQCNEEYAWCKLPTILECQVVKNTCYRGCMNEVAAEAPPAAALVDSTPVLQDTEQCDRDCFTTYTQCQAGCSPQCQQGRYQYDQGCIKECWNQCDAAYIPCSKGCDPVPRARVGAIPFTCDWDYEACMSTYQQTRSEFTKKYCMDKYQSCKDSVSTKVAVAAEAPLSTPVGECDYYCKQTEQCDNYCKQENAKCTNNCWFDSCREDCQGKWLGDCARSCHAMDVKAEVKAEVKAATVPVPVTAPVQLPPLCHLMCDQSYTTCVKIRGAAPSLCDYEKAGCMRNCPTKSSGERLRARFAGM